MKNKKNVIFIIIMVLIIIAICFVAPKLGEKKNQEAEKDAFSKIDSESQNINESEKKSFKNISVEDYLEIYTGNEKKLVFVGSSNCGYCETAVPIIQNIMYKNNIDIYYLSTDDFTEESEEQFMSSNEYLNDFYTPLLMVVSEGKIHDYVDELKDSIGYTEFLIKNNFIESEK